MTPLNFWEPSVARAMQHRISEATDANWADAFTSQPHVSEFIVYGVFVDEVLFPGTSRPPSDTTICHNVWDHEPLSLRDALAFADRLPRQALAMMISGHSHTPLDIRRAAAERCAHVVAAAGARRAEG